MKSARRGENVLCGIAEMLDSEFLRHRAHFYKNLSHIQLVINKNEKMQRREIKKDEKRDKNKRQCKACDDENDEL